MNEQLKNETRDNHSANEIVDKRGRLISAAVIATIILSFIAVSVFGIFQLTTRMMVVCPRDLPVNDPAPILWQDIVSDQVREARLGVPDKITDVYLRGTKLADGKSQ